MREQRKGRRKRLARLLILVCTVLVAIVIFTRGKGREAENVLPAQKSDAQQAELVNQLDAEISLSPTPMPTQSPGLGDAVATALSGSNGLYGVVIENLKTGEYFSQNAYTPFDSGSLYKLWVMAAVYQQIDDGKIKKDTMLKVDVVKLYKSFGLTPDPLEQSTGTISQKVSDALDSMITISSNNSALLLTNAIKTSPIIKFLHDEGLNNSHVGVTNQAPTTTAADTARFFEKLYKKEIVSQNASEEMLDLLKRQKLNDKLPKYLPDDVEIAHKTGELDEFTHDAGIIFSDYGDYIIVVLSKSDNPPLAQERISLISQDVYNYFSQEAEQTDTTPSPTSS